MAHERLRAALRDVAFTTATPFERTDGSTGAGAGGGAGAVDHDALAANLDALYDAGARLFLACGNTGEYYALTDEERAAVVETHVEAVGDREGATVVGGVGGSRRQATALARAYADAGADGLMAMHPEFTYLHADGLANYYRELATATDLGLVLYKRGPAVPRRTLADLSTHDDVVGVKFATDDVKEFAQSVADAPGELAWVNGIAERYALAFDAEGAVGYTTGLGNFAPEATLALFDALEAGDRERARELRDLLRPIEDLREEPGKDNPVAAANNVPAVKYGMELAGLTGGPCRTPLVGLSDEDEARVEKYYAAIQDADL